jgi:Cell wall hydrolyses involved in spore germination
MLTNLKTSSRIGLRRRSLWSRVTQWWTMMSASEQRATVYKGVAITACAMTAAVALPTLSSRIESESARAEFRKEAQFLATKIETRAPVESADTASVFENPWMRTVEYALKREPGSALDKFGQRYRDLAALESYTSFEPAHFKMAEQSRSESDCLATAIYYEARSESVLGQIAVAEVIMNRVADYRYPDTVCKVVFQGSERSTGCQFSFTCDGSMDRGPRGRYWDRAKTVAAHVLMDLNKPLTGAATHYHTDYVDPIWNKSLVHTKTIGTHIFYRFPRGSEWQKIRERQNNNGSRET